MEKIYFLSKAKKSISVDGTDMEIEKYGLV